MASLKKNFFFNIVLTMSEYIFPLIVYPYASRVLGVDKIGLNNFADSIVDYFTIFSMMGIHIIGIREIAKHKDNLEELSAVFSQLFSLNTISTFIALVVFINCIVFVPKLHENSTLMIVGTSKMVFNYMLINWLYSGLENFKYITVRTILIKLVYVICVFIFIHSKDDYVIYYLLGTITIGLNAVVNLIYAKNFARLHFTFHIKKEYVRAFIILGVYTVLTAMHTTFNTTFLGFMVGDTEVGYYATANKLLTLMIAFYTAFTSVMLPRMSSLSKNEGHFKEMVNVSLDILFVFIIPLILYVTFFAPEIILIISGKGYEGAIMPLRVITPLFFLLGYNQIQVVQILIPLKKDKAVVTNSVIAASFGIIMNILFVSTYKSTGSAAILMLSELLIVISAQIFVTKYTNLHFPFKKLSLNILMNIPLALIFFYLRMNVHNTIYLIALASVVGAIYIPITTVYIAKNPVMSKFMQSLVHRK